MTITPEHANLVLKEFGVPSHIKGHRYIKHALLVISENPDALDQITNTLYPTIAMHFGVTWPSVERCIRHAVTMAMDRLYPEAISELFGNTIDGYRGGPSNKQFIATIVGRLEELT